MTNNTLTALDLSSDDNIVWNVNNNNYQNDRML